MEFATKSFLTLDDSYSHMARKMVEQRDRDAKNEEFQRKMGEFAEKSFLTLDDSYSHVKSTKGKKEGCDSPVCICNIHTASEEIFETREQVSLAW